MKSAIQLIKKDLERHLVTVYLPGEKQERALFLTLVSALSSKVEDLKTTYGEKVTEIHLKVAKKVFGEGETQNTYGVFVDENLQMVFAFNRDFADFDQRKKTIVYKDIDEVILGQIKSREKEPSPSSWKKLLPRRRVGDISGGGGMLVRYSLMEKTAP